MSKQVQNEYPFDDTLTPDDIRRALTGDFDGFKYFFERCMVLQDRDTRQYIHPEMNAGQELIARTILSYVDKGSRATSHKECVICGPRQFGKSTLLTAISNYIVAYVSGMENLNVVTTMHQATAATKFFKQKLAPIISSVHPSIYPTIERDTLGTSTLLQYKDVKGIKRGGYYEITSAGSNSVRSGTVSVWLADEPSEYRNPEMVEDAISGAISSYGWSFTAYIGTFSDRLSNYFLDKIKTAINNPDEIQLVFIPWFLVYGRPGDESGVNMEVLDEYERTVIVPEMIKHNIDPDLFACKIGWYRRRALRTAKMRYEFPTSIDDILQMTSDKKVFAQASIDRQAARVEPGQPYRFTTDNITGRVEAHETDVSPFTMYRKPVYGHRYKLVVDPITASNEDTDFFAMSMFDDNTLEQVAVFRGKQYSVEDYADFAVSMCKIYNNAVICPESNVADAFIVSVKALGYYFFYYPNQLARRRKEPGIRTTASSKASMIDRLSLLLDQDKIKIYDRDTVDELNWFEKKIKSTGGAQTVRMAAHKGKHDDLVSCAWIYAGTLDDRQITGKKTGFAVL